jgi:transposase
MLMITAKHRVYLAIQAVDFRMGIDGLFALCKHQLSLDPFSGHYFIFRNRLATAIKILAYDATGFWLCHKRLSQGRFRHWPTSATSVVVLSPAQLQVLLQLGDPKGVPCTPWRLID